MQFIGPSFKKGPYPALFYFALSKEETLHQDPYNQLVQFLADSPIRIFSFTLPFHEKPFDKNTAMKKWAEEMEKGHDFFRPFLDQVKDAIKSLIQNNLTYEDTIAVAGLSRGGMVASHVAAENPDIRYILEFAPVTNLSFMKNFHHISDHPLVKKYSVYSLVPLLCDRHIRIYIGNYDKTVGTKNSFLFLEQLSQTALAQRIKPPKIEMVISPAIGYQGHGTSPETFKAGADWILKKLTSL